MCCPDDEILLQKHPKDIKKCLFCNKTFDRQVSHLYKNHMNMHLSCQFLIDKNCFKFNECLRCLKIFSSPEKLENHICEPRSNQSNLQCTECEKELDNVKSLKEHLVFLHIKIFVCPINECLIEKPSFNVFYYHLQKSHTGFITCINSYPCDYCLTDFKTYFLLERHRKNGSCAAKKFQCDHCGKSYGHRRELVAHLLASLKRYICNFCGKAFKDGTGNY